MNLYRAFFTVNIEKHRKLCYNEVGKAVRVCTNFA